MEKTNFEINKDPFSHFLDEMKVHNSTISLKEFKDKLKALDKVRLSLLNLQKEGFIIEEGTTEIYSISENKEKELIYEIPDFIVYKEDVKFMVFLEINKDIYTLDRDRWKKISANLIKDPTITAVTLCWTKIDLNSCCLDSFSIKKYLEGNQNEINFEQESFNILPEKIREFYNIQFVDWKISEDLTKLIDSQERVSIKDLLSEKFMFYLKQLKETNFRIKEKIKAQSLINKKDFEDILNFLHKFLAKKKIERLDNKEIDKFITRLIE